MQHLALVWGFPLSSTKKKKAVSTKSKKTEKGLKAFHSNKLYVLNKVKAQLDELR